MRVREYEMQEHEGATVIWITGTDDAAHSGLRPKMGYWSKS